MNRIVLIGRLVADPQLRYTQKGTAVTNFRIAVDRPYNSNQEKREADFLDVICWQKLAEIVCNNLQKGRLVAVDGRLQIRQYEYEGQKRTAVEVYADNVRFLDRKSDSAAGGYTSGYQGGSGYGQGSQGGSGFGGTGFGQGNQGSGGFSQGNQGSGGFNQGNQGSGGFNQGNQGNQGPDSFPEPMDPAPDDVPF
jgi:single-strand DNA-binding protein